MNSDLPPGHFAHDIQLIEGDVRVDVSWQGEGESGDYDPDDVDDVPLYRFDVYRRSKGAGAAHEQWEEVENSSYCTQLNTSLPRAAIELFSRMVMNEVSSSVLSGQSIKPICEWFSWLPMSTFDDCVAKDRAEKMHEAMDSATPPAPPAPAAPRM